MSLSHFLLLFIVHPPAHAVRRSGDWFVQCSSDISEEAVLFLLLCIQVCFSLTVLFLSALLSLKRFEPGERNMGKRWK